MSHLLFSLCLADAAEECGQPLTEKPVTLAIHEVAEGKLDANQMNLKVENAIG